ncbi:15245_t:CDS:2 [Acaulospora colombiana]|uniref:15245_t:CDS:1 n=1 Tax=Acaulospora colombiana TaxID=27376 RepID=A0ACA9NAZ4_9GLOM|nr:15245_t:CDS:2 [Acaulospora colombiana]
MLPGILDSLTVDLHSINVLRHSSTRSSVGFSCCGVDDAHLRKPGRDMRTLPRQKFDPVSPLLQIAKALWVYNRLAVIFGSAMDSGAYGTGTKRQPV